MRIRVPFGISPVALAGVGVVLVSVIVGTIWLTRSPSSHRPFVARTIQTPTNSTSVAAGRTVDVAARVAAGSPALVEVSLRAGAATFPAPNAVKGVNATVPFRVCALSRPVDPLLAVVAVALVDSHGDDHAVVGAAGLPPAFYDGTLVPKACLDATLGFGLPPATTPQRLTFVNSGIENVSWASR